MEHLSAVSLPLALAGDAGVARHFAVHLAQPCEVCERYLMEVGVLDGQVDSLLLRLAPAGERLDEVGLARVRQFFVTLNDRLAERDFISKYTVISHLTNNQEQPSEL